jgi:hypothetical protein
LFAEEDGEGGRKDNRNKVDEWGGQTENDYVKVKNEEGKCLG